MDWPAAVAAPAGIVEGRKRPVTEKESGMQSLTDQHHIHMDDWLAGNLPLRRR